MAAAPEGPPAGRRTERRASAVAEAGQAAREQGIRGGHTAAYQLESKEGTGLVKRHIEELARETGRPLKLKDLMDAVHPSGGDYTRMWTRVLAEDHYLTGPPGPPGQHGRPGEPGRPSRRKLHLGSLFDAFY
ncbi:hypothetical protein, partial [Streptomyces caniscabiei]|uniref:hypothetical protein n=1 Tax=Streptomyces caniscabiei TaxID=2746961 RepID=UPI0015C4EF22